MTQPEQRQEWIFELLKLEGLTYSECLSRFLVKFSKTEQTFSADWVKANARFKIYQLSVNKAKDEVSIQYEVDTLKQGLKSKQERLLEYQNEINSLQKRIDKNEDYKYLIANGVIQKVVCEIDLKTVAILHRAIKDLRSEISKIEGDYAPKEIITTDIKPITFTVYK